MACSGRENLVAYLDGELAAPEAEAVRLHLDVCDECREYARLLKKSYDALQHLEAPEAPYGFAAKVSARASRRARPVFVYAALAAAAALVILAIVRVAIPRGDALAPAAAPDSPAIATAYSNGEDALTQMELLDAIDLVDDVDVMEEFEMLAELDAIEDLELSDQEATI